MIEVLLTGGVVGMQVVVVRTRNMVRATEVSLQGLEIEDEVSNHFAQSLKLLSYYS